MKQDEDSGPSEIQSQLKRKKQIAMIKEQEEALMRQKLGLEPVTEIKKPGLSEFEIKELTK